MPLRVKCNLCPPDKPTELVSPIIEKTMEADVANVGKLMLHHMQFKHQEAFKKGVLEASAKWTGLMVTKYFDSENEQFSKDKEEIRDQMAELLCYGAPDDEEDEEEEDELEDDEDESDEDEDEDEDCEDEEGIEDEDEDEEYLGPDGDEDDEDDEDEEVEELVIEEGKNK